MRKDKAADAWRYVKDVNKYRTRIESIEINNVAGMVGPLTINFNSGMTVICGKNGSGKTTLLRTIHYAFQNNPVLNGRHEKASFNAKIYVNNKEIEQGDDSIFDDSIVRYIEPSIDCSKINNFLQSITNYEELLEGIEPNVILNKETHVKNISQIVGKNYTSIYVYEVDGVLEDKTFPFVKVCCEGGVEYDNLSMGMGEFVCIYLYWFLNFIGKNKILLIEEFENFISAYSQVRLMDYMAHISSSNGIWTVMSSHSEHVVNKIPLDSIRILYLKNNDSKIVVPKHASNYLQALGVSCEKTGAFLVEDKVAQIALKTIINKTDPELIRDKQIVGLRCDSNIEKVIKHYEPHSVDAQSYKLVAVFDADQRDKITALNGKFIGVSCLPAINKVAPEIELWSLLDSHSSEISSRLGLANDEALAFSISSCESDDHHDRLYTVSEYISTPFESFVSAIVCLWCELNELLTLKFILSLKFANEKIRKADILSYVKDISSLSVDDIFGESMSGDDNDLYHLKFDGLKMWLEIV